MAGDTQERFKCFEVRLLGPATYAVEAGDMPAEHLPDRVLLLGERWSQGGENRA